MTTPIEANLDQLLGHENFVRGILRDLIDPDAIDDLVQGTWIEALKNPPREPRAMRTWLGTVAKNLARKRLRTEIRREGRERTAAKPESLPSTEATLERLATQRQVSLAVQELAEPYRTTVLLRYFHDLPLGEIAKQTETTENNARQRLFRAHEMLKKELEQEYGTDWRRAPVLLAMIAPSKPVAVVHSMSLWAMMTKPLPLATIAAVILLSLASFLWPWGEAPAVIKSTATDQALGQGSQTTEPERKELAASPMLSPSTGMVWTGQVIDPQGTPLAGVALGYSTTQALPDGETVKPPDGASSASDYGVDYKLAIDGTLRFVRIGVTDTAGTFELKGLSPGSILRVGEGYAPLRSWRVSSSVRTGLRLIAARAVQLGGTVTDENGKPMAKVTIEPKLLDLIDLPFTTDTMAPVAYATGKTDSQGRFLVTGLPGGQMQLEFSTSRYMIRVFDLEQRDLTNQVVEMMPISNTPRFVSGVVVDEHDRPLSDVRVGMGSKKVKTDHAGRFEIAFEPGEFLDPKAKIYACRRGERTAVQDLGMALWHGDVRDKKLVLGTPTLSITGRLLRADGKPDAGKLVFIWDGTETSCSDTAENLAASEGVPMLVIGGYPVWAGARTDADGKFVITGLSDRPYRLRAYDEKTFYAHSSEPVPAGTLDFEMLWPKDQHFHFRGRLVTPAGTPAVGLAVAFGTEVYRVGEEGMRKSRRLAVTDTDGKFDIAEMPRYDAYLTVSGEGFITRELAIEEEWTRAAVSLRIDRLCHFRITGVPTDRGITGFRMRNAKGEALKIRKRKRGFGRESKDYPLETDRTAVLSTSERAAVLEFFNDFEIVSRQPVALEPGLVTSLSFQ